MTGDDTKRLQDIRERLASVKAKRGRLMPNHAVLAIEFPEALGLYEALYAATTMTFGALSPRDKKLVQLTVVASAQIPVGGHHVTDFLTAGGTAEQVRAILRLAMLAVGANVPDAVGPTWTAVPRLTYSEIFDERLVEFAIAAGIDTGVIELALVAAHATQRAWPRVAFHIERAKARGVADSALAEALTTLMLTAGNPIFAQACGVWHRLIAEGTIEASPEYRAAIEAANA